MSRLKAAVVTAKIRGLKSLTREDRTVHSFGNERLGSRERAQCLSFDSTCHVCIFRHVSKMNSTCG